MLCKVFVTGALPRIPKNPQHRDIVLAVMCLNLRRRHPYAEWEINRYLRGFLTTVNAAVDHVTCRRYLVDLGFVKRDRAGARYLLNYPRIELVLSADAADSAERLLQDALHEHKG